MYIIMNTYVYCQILLYLKNIIPHAVGNSKIFCHLIFKQELSNAPNKIRSGQIRHHWKKRKKPRYVLFINFDVILINVIIS